MDKKVEAEWIKHLAQHCSAIVDMSVERNKLIDDTSGWKYTGISEEYFNELVKRFTKAIKISMDMVEDYEQAGSIGRQD